MSMGWTTPMGTRVRVRVSKNNALHPPLACQWPDASAWVLQHVLLSIKAPAELSSTAQLRIAEVT